MATGTLRTPSILLVSNSIDERELCTRALNGWGYEVVKAATTVLAYRIATTTLTDMVITVAHCAGSMSGLELTRRLRLHTRTTAVPIIVLTKETRRQDDELSIKAGADMFLERPVSGDVLREHVVRLLVASGRLSHQSSHHQHERVSFVRVATNRQRSQAASSSQTRTHTSGAGVAIERECRWLRGRERSSRPRPHVSAMSSALGISAEVARPLGGRARPS
jgi:DNA-binding response OmpR family regulator